MLFGDNNKGILSLNEVNHNEKLNPHSQYDRFLTYNSPSNGTSTSNLYFKIFDINIQQNPSAMGHSYEQYANGLILNFHYYSAYTSNRSYDEGVVSVIATFNGSGGINPFLCSKSFGTNGTKIEFYLFYKQNTDNTITTEYNLKLYAKVSNNYMNLSIIPYVFNTVGQSYNYYNKLYLSVGTNHKERLDSLFYNFQNDSAISATDLSSVTSGYSTVTDYGAAAIKSVTYSGGSTTFDVTGVTYLLLASSSLSQVLTTLTGGVTGQTITLISYNERTSLTSGTFNNGSPTSNTMILKNDCNVVIPRGRTLTLKNYNGVWYEIARDFLCDGTITYTNGSTLDLTNGGIIVLSATSTATLSTFTGGTTGQEITVVATTSNTTLSNNTFNNGSPTANTIILKSATNVTLAVGNVIKLKYMLGAWIEIARNF